MKTRFLLLFVLLTLFLTLNSQYNKKKFKEGYIIRGGDTVRCKIFTGSSVNEYEQVLFKYSDNKFEEPISYFAGSSIKGYGVKADSVFKHFYAFPRPKKGLFKNKQEYVYGLVHAGGYLKLMEYSIESYAPGSMRPGGGFYPGSFHKSTSYYLYKTGTDSAYNIQGDGSFLSGIDEEFLANYFVDYPALVSKIKKKVKFNDLLEYVKEYNSWYEEKKKNEQQ